MYKKKKYIGQWKDGVQHGKGTYTYTDGSKYVGMLKDGKQHGKGTLTYPANGGEYIGCYLYTSDADDE